MKYQIFPVLMAAILFPVILSAQNTVTVSEDEDSFTLANGVITSKISRHSGDLLSLQYKNLEMLDAGNRSQSAYWSHNTARGKEIVDRVTIDPKTNGGERGEISVKTISNGGQMGSGPGGSVAADIEIRYTLGRGDSGLYTYCIFTHPTNYPATSVGEARFCSKLNSDIFDWMTVDSNRNLEMITAYDWDHGTQLNFKEARRMNTGIYKGQVEHKYDYAANQFEVRTWGWSSTRHNVGIWFINPSVEYLSGGPTKMELSAHRDATFNTHALTAPAPPCLLNYWRSSHYGGSVCSIAATDMWTKVIGPFLIYCNSADGHDGLWRDALARQTLEEKAWPFDWVNGVDYPKKARRATVSGKIILTDPQAPNSKMKNLLVGLSAPDYAPPIVQRSFRAGRRPGGFGFDLSGGGEDEAIATNQNNFAGNFTNRFRPEFSARRGTNGFRGRFARFAFPSVVDWQIDARHYEFWVRADEDGNFQIPNVRPGSYTLHAIADGVLGELDFSNVVVSAGKNVALGDLQWRPVRYGRQLWDIGIPNRTASEFFKGDDYFHWGWYLEYPKLFSQDVHFAVGKSDFHRDWFFEQVPHDEDSYDTTGQSFGRETTWAISFNLPEAPRGKATLRVAICGVGARALTATMNSETIGSITDLVYNATINRDGIGGIWSEHDLKFSASRMRAGENNLALTIPAGGLTSGIMYDYLRLELDDSVP